jgi:hypothetical protein
MTNEVKNGSSNTRKRIIRIIGFLLLTIGIILAIMGGITFSMSFSMGPSMDLDQAMANARTSMTAMGLLGGGIFMIIASLTIIGFTYVFSSFGKMAESTSKALNSSFESDYDRYEKIIEESSKKRATGVNRSESMTQDTIVKIKCQLCGALNEDDANFCVQCSEPL